MTVSSYSNTLILNNCLTLAEGFCNLIGYLPGTPTSLDLLDSTEDISTFKTKVAQLRQAGGKLLAITALISGVALYTISLLALDQKLFYKKLSIKAAYYFGQGVLNIGRGYLEEKNWGCVTLAYDIYGRKFLPYNKIDPRFDIQARSFRFIKVQLDKLNIPTLIPSAIDKLSTMFTKV